MRRLLFLAILIGTGCGPGQPICGFPRDLTGRLIARCDNPRQEAVCDEPGMEAHFASGAMGIQLIGGQRALCDMNDEVVCPVGTVGEPFCITDPEL